MSLPAAPKKRRLPFGFLALGLGCLLAFALELSLGSVRIPLAEVVKALAGVDGADPCWEQIVRLFRLPRALTAILAGAALGVSGLEAQTFFRNPLADPFVLGISSGASLGVAVVMMAAGFLGATTLGALGIGGNLSVVAAAAVGATAVFSVVMLVAKRVRDNMTLLILGLLFGYAAGAVVGILTQFADKDQTRGFILWTFGSFGGVTWSQMPYLATACAAGLLCALALCKSLNAMLLGQDYARSMGMSVKRVRFGVVASSSLLAGTVTAYCGPIAFVGIAVPHLARLLFKTSDHRTLIPATALSGALVAMLADLVAQMPGLGVTLPLNAVTCLLGAPLVIALILKRQRMMETFAS